MAVGRVQVQSPLWAASFFFFFNSSLTGPWARDANTISPKDTGALFCPQFSHRLIVCFSFDTWVLDRVENLCMPKEDHCWSLMFCKSSYSLVVSLKRGKIFFSPKSRYFVFTMFLWVKEPSFQISLFMYENPVQWSSGFFSSDFKSWQTCIS